MRLKKLRERGQKVNSLGMARSGRLGGRESGGGKNGKSTGHEGKDKENWKRKGRRRINDCNGIGGGGKVERAFIPWSAVSVVIHVIGFCDYLLPSNDHSG